MNWFSLWLETSTPATTKGGNVNFTYTAASGGAAQFMNPGDDTQYSVAQSQVGPGQNEYQVLVANKTDVLVEWTRSDGIKFVAQVNTGMGYDANNQLPVDFPTS